MNGHSTILSPTGATSAYADWNSLASTRTELISRGVWLLVAISILGAAWHMRWSLVTRLPWQCDELPVLMRNTGVAGHAANEAEAREFAPSVYTALRGSLRSLQSRGTIAQHVTTNFWTNLTVHLFGCSPAAGRVAPFLWSMIAVIGVAWAAWMAGGRFLACCLAAWAVAFSPHAIAYGAQARGYAEALALTPLLIIFIELLRRRPERKVLGTAVFLCALQLSLTFYTMWIYWVLPTIFIMVTVVPRKVGDIGSRRTFGVAAVAIAVGLCAAMAIFTIDRWDKLTFVASYISTSLEPGIPLFTRISEFLIKAGGRLLPAALWVLLVALAGIPVLRRSPVRWWLGVMAASVIVPVLFALVNGTPGYTRTFGYLVAPVAILFGLGGEAVFRAVQSRLHSRLVGISAGLLLLASTAWAYPSAQRRASDILLPDWGALVSALNKEPETVGPRWVCHDRANYWQINWYGASPNCDEILAASPGFKIEVVMGTQYNDAGEPVVYRLSTGDGTIRAAELPAFLAEVPPREVRFGIEVRRWIGSKLDANVPKPVVGPGRDSGLTLILIAVENPLSLDQWKQLIREGGGASEEVVTFKGSLSGGGTIESLIAPAHLLPTILRTLTDRLGIETADIHAFRLSSK